LDMQDGLREYAGPGHWNDPDMLEVGVGRLTTSENRAHFSMWCMLAAPLITGNDLSNMTDEVRAILTDPTAISVNQDPLGIQGLRYQKADSLETWFKPLSNGEWALCFLNRAKDAKQINFDFAQNIVDDTFAKRILDANKQEYKLTNVWTKKEMGTTKKVLSAQVPSHDVLMLILSPVEKKGKK